MNSGKPKTASTIGSFIFRNENLIIPAIFIIAFFLRLFYMVELKNNFPPFNDVTLDAQEMYNWAVQISKGNFGEGAFLLAPLYPFLLGALFFIFGYGYLLPRLLNVVIGALNCIVIYFLGKKVFNQKSGILASLFAVFYKPFLFYEGQILAVTLNIFLVSATIILLTISKEKNIKRYWAASGACLGLTIFTRANFLLLVPFIILWIVFILLKDTKKSIFFSAAAFLLGLILTLFPVVIRNYLVSGDYIISSSAAGQVFFQGNNINADGTMSSLSPEMVSPQLAKRFFKRKAMEAFSKTDMKPTEVSKIWFNVGMKFIKDNPARAIKLFIKKIFLFYNFYEIPGNLNIYFMERFSSLLRLPLFTFSIIGPLGLFGILLSFREWRKFILFYIYLVIYTLSVVIFFVLSRFRIPVLPVIIIFAPLSFFDFYEKIKNHNWKGFLCSVVIFLSLYFVVNITIIEKREYISYSNLGEYYMRAAKFDKAMGIFRKLLEKYPEKHDIHINIAMVYRKQRKYDDALKELAMAIKGAPNYARLYIEIGDIYRLMGKYEEAVLAFQTANQLEPMFADAVNEIGRVYLVMGNLDMAEQKFKEAVAIEPDFPLSYNNLGIIYFRRGLMGTAIQQFQKALQYSPHIFNWDNRSAMYNLGLAYRKTGKIQKAIEQFKEIVEYDPDHINSLFVLGILYNQKGEQSNAVFYLNKVLEIMPDHVNAKKELEKIRGNG